MEDKKSKSNVNSRFLAGPFDFAQEEDKKSENNGSSSYLA
jgi:hypothetical protein